MSHPVPPPSSPSNPSSAEPYRAEPPRSSAPQPTALPTTLAYTNTFAVVAVILAFMQPVAGIVFGHLALGQIKRGGDTGRGLALTGLIVGYVMIAFWVAFIIFYVIFIVSIFASMGALISEFPTDPYYS